jgi:hypothetical protein
MQKGYEAGLVSESEFDAARLGHQRALAALRDEQAAREENLNFRLAAMDKDRAEKDEQAQQKKKDLDDKARAADLKQEADQKKIREDLDFRLADLTRTEALKEQAESDKKIAKQQELADKVDDLQERSLDGQANGFAFAMARIDAQAEKSFDALWKMYGKDEANWANLMAAKARLDEMAGQQKRQVMEREAAQLQAFFDRDILAAEGWRDAMGRIINDVAQYFESAVFKMVTLWIEGQSEMVNASVQSGGLGGIIGILGGVLGGLLGGGGSAITEVAGQNIPSATGGILSGGGSAVASLRHFSLGGDTSAMTPIVVGEEGPEVFMPTSAGSIIPNNRLGGTTINNNYIDAHGSDIGLVQRLVPVLEEIQRRAVADAVIATRETSLRGS